MIVVSSSDLGKSVVLKNLVNASENRQVSDVLVNLANNLTGLVYQAARNGSSFDQVERDLWKKVLAMGLAAAQLFVNLQGNGDLGASVTTAEDLTLYKSETVLTRKLRTIFGEISFESFVYSRGSKQKIELRPIDARLNLPEDKPSYLLQEFSQLFCVEKAFGVGEQQFETVFLQPISVAVLEQINRDMGAQADRFLDELPKPESADEGELLVLTADGKGVPLVRADAQSVPVFDEKERPGNRRMATLGCVYTVDRFQRTPEQIVAALFRDKTVLQPEDRPTPCGKHYRGYFSYVEAGEEPIPSAYLSWTWLATEAAARRQPGQPVIRLMDGQLSLWEASDACLDDFIKKHPGENGLIDILDIIHVSSYVWRAAKVFHTHKEHQEAFAYDRLLRILHGEVDGVVTGLRRMATQQNLKGAARKVLRTVCNYFEKNASRMRYDEYLQAGYPIASGVIEGACRHIIKDRMEQGGMRWTLTGAQAMLNVRAVCASSEWEKFGQWRQSEEAKRVHPHRALVSNYQGITA